MEDGDSPKVAKLDKRQPFASHDECVLRLQVSIDNALAMTILQRNGQLQASQPVNSRSQDSVSGARLRHCRCHVLPQSKHCLNLLVFTQELQLSNWAECQEGSSVLQGQACNDNHCAVCARSLPALVV